VKTAMHKLICGSSIMIFLGLLYPLSLGRAAGQVVAWGSNFYGQTNVPPDLTNAVAIAAGYAHSLALKADGTVINWGAFLYADNHRGTIWVPAGLKDVAALAAGYGHDLALITDGGVIAWGYGYDSGGVTNVPPPSLTNVAAISTSNGQNLSLREDGSMVAWSYPSYGSANPQPALSGNVVAIACGQSHSLALKADATVAAWGNNTSGQTTVPPNLTNAVAAAVGYSHSLALKADGTVLVWGDNSRGQRNVPIGLTNVVAIAAGGYHSLALRRDGKVVAWGSNPSGESTVPAGLTNVAAISAGYSHNLVLAGEVSPILNRLRLNLTVPNGTPVSLPALAIGSQPLRYQWRFNGNDLPEETNAVLRLESVQFTNSGAYSLVVSNVFGAVRSEDMTLNVAPLVIVVQPQSQSVFGGATAVLEVNVTGLAPRYQWQFNGTNLAGATNSMLTLTNVLPNQAGAYSVVVSNEYGTVLSSDAVLVVTPLGIIAQPQSQSLFKGAAAFFRVTAAGLPPLNYQWRFNGTNLPNATNAFLELRNVQFEQSGLYSVVVSNAFDVKKSIDVDLFVGEVAAWGNNGYGQSFPPSGMTNVIALSGGRYHSLALKADGTVIAWGDNTFGQTTVPVGLTSVVAIAAGGDFSLALKRDGTVIGWGWNYFGQIATPVGLTNVVAISAGSVQSLALEADGTVVSWGDVSYVPSVLSNAVAIAAGDDYNLALETEGTIVAWSKTGFSIISAARQVLEIAAFDQTLALQADGTVVGWGNNYYGQATPPSALRNVVAIGAGVYHSLALRADSKVLAWGDNSSGQTNVPFGLTNAVAIEAGFYHNLALVGDTAPVVKPSLLRPTWTTNGFSVSLQTQSGHVYRLEYEDSLTEAGWISLPLAAGNGRVLTLIDSTSTGSQRYYRVGRW